VRAVTAFRTEGLLLVPAETDTPTAVNTVDSDHGGGRGDSGSGGGPDGGASALHPASSMQGARQPRQPQQPTTCSSTGSGEQVEEAADCSVLQAPTHAATTSAMLPEHALGQGGCEQRASTADGAAGRASVAAASQPPPVSHEVMVRLVVEGSSFMMYQIRKMVGLALAVARGAAPPGCITAALSPHAHVAVPLAPATGLLLDEVWYDSCAPTTTNATSVTVIATTTTTTTTPGQGQLHPCAPAAAAQAFKRAHIYPSIARQPPLQMWQTLAGLNDANFRFSSWPALLAAGQAAAAAAREQGTGAGAELPDGAGSGSQQQQRAGGGSGRHHGGVRPGPSCAMVIASLESYGCKHSDSAHAPRHAWS